MARKPGTGSTTSPKAISLHIGLNTVYAADHGAWHGPLAACEFDAQDMAAIAQAKAMKSTVLRTKKATRTNVLASMRSAAKALKAGDLFFVSYSGHGGQVLDVSGDEPDKQDETWCLYDGQLIVDELYFELIRFAAGVRILVLSGSCHSGSITRAPPLRPGYLIKLMPADVAMRVYREHQAFYDQLQLDVAKAAGQAPVDPDTALASVAASSRLSAIVKQFNPAALLISGCKDNQTSLDGDHNGAFTEQLLRVWSNGRSTGNYGMFHARIKAALPATQTPNLYTLGRAGTFLAQTPFTV